MIATRRAPARKPKAAKLPVATEHQEQVALFDWLELESRKYHELRLAFAIPNGASKSWSQAKKFQAEGLRAGVPDVLLPVARGKYHGLFIEMKRAKGGVVSPEQEHWLLCMEIEGYRTDVCRGWIEAQAAVMNYMSLPKPTHEVIR